MQTFISAFPIDKPFQMKLGIYSTGYVEPEQVGPILHSLIEAGYIEINSFVECYDQTEKKENLNRLTIHCSKHRN